MLKRFFIQPKETWPWNVCWKPKVGGDEAKRSSCSSGWGCLFSWPRLQRHSLEILCHHGFDESHHGLTKAQFYRSLNEVQKTGKVFSCRTTQPSTRHSPDTVDVLDGVTDLPTHFFIVALHLKEPGRRTAGGKEQSGEQVKFWKIWKIFSVKGDDVQSEYNRKGVFTTVNVLTQQEQGDTT